MNPADVLQVLLDPNERENLVKAMLQQAKAARHDFEREYWTECAEAIKRAVRDIANGRGHEWRMRCGGAWYIDSDALGKAWNARPTLAERADLVKSLRDPPSEWYDRKLKLDRRGDFWRRKPCDVLSGNGVLCTDCSKIAAKGRSLLETYRSDLASAQREQERQTQQRSSQPPGAPRQRGRP